MCRILAGSISVMAAEAVVDNVGVIESGRCPAHGCVAVIAYTGDMCRVLALIVPLWQELQVPITWM